MGCDFAASIVLFICHNLVIQTASTLIPRLACGVEVLMWLFLNSWKAIKSHENCNGSSWWRLKRKANSVMWFITLIYRHPRLSETFRATTEKKLIRLHVVTQWATHNYDRKHLPSFNIYLHSDIPKKNNRQSPIKHTQCFNFSISLSWKFLLAMNYGRGKSLRVWQPWAISSLRRCLNHAHHEGILINIKIIRNLQRR